MTTPSRARRRPRRTTSSAVLQKKLMRKRLRIIVSVVLVAMVVLVGRLAWVQLVWGPDLSAKAVTQRERVYIEPARRGEILDRDGQRLAYTMKSLSLIHI